jgi:glutamyl-tRNA reductase
MYIANLSVTHRDAPHNVLSQLTLMEDDLESFYQKLLAQKEINGAIVVQTCNRFEIYFRGGDEGLGMAQAKKVMLDRFGANVGKYMLFKSYLGTLTHLFKLVSSIDSMIVGENQIQAQIRDALNYAKINNHSDMVLDTVFMKALSIGKKVRIETKIADGKVSVSSAAVDLAHQNNPINNKKILMLGSGKMAGLLASYLGDFEINELVVIGRTPERVELFCTEYCARQATMADFEKELKDADLLFSATSCPRVLVTKEIIEKILNGREKPLTLIDIAMPADIDPSVSDLENVNFYCIDDLKKISEKNKAIRQKEIEKAELIIDDELEVFKGHLQNFHLDRFLPPLNQYIEEIRQRELDKAMSMLDDKDHKTKMVLEGLSKTLTKKIMHNFMSEIRTKNTSSSEMERFIKIFMGNLNVSQDKNEKTKKQHPHQGHGQ